MKTPTTMRHSQIIIEKVLYIVDTVYNIEDRLNKLRKLNGGYLVSYRITDGNIKQITETKSEIRVQVIHAVGKYNRAWFFAIPKKSIY